MKYVAFSAVLFAACAFGLGAQAASLGDNWPTWRGPNSDGAAPKGNPPITWSETENIKWKVAIPGDGDGTPVIWGDKIFLQMAVATGEDVRVSPPKDAGREIFTKMPTIPFDFKVLCLSRKTGELLWEKTVATAIPHEGHHPDTSFAAYSVVTDGEHIWASFGSRGLHCYDLDGNHKWSADLIEMLSLRGFGEGSSPALAGDVVVVVADHEGDSKVFAFDKLSGKQLWSRDRTEKTTWATPHPVEVDGKYQVIVSGTDKIYSYDAKTGDVVWESGGLLQGAIPSPVIGFNNVYCMTGYQKYSLLAIELGHKGDLTGSDAIKWSLDRGTPYVSSPALYEGRLYFVEGNKASASCYDAQTGKPYFERERLTGLKNVYASPLGVGGHIYISDRKGTTAVLKMSDSFEVVATNKLSEGFDASPIAIGDELYLRGEKHLYCIASQ